MAKYCKVIPEVSDLILQTKLNPPLMAHEMVPRSHLQARLSDGLIIPEGFSRRLTLISAPAGYGKTSLAISWLRSLQVPFAWFSLDERDNDPKRFMTYLVTTLRQARAEIGSMSIPMLDAPQPPPLENVLMALINEINVLRAPLILVLDDYHSIQAAAIHQQVSMLLERQPDWLHQVILSREDPPLPVHRLRARRDVLEIHQDALRFSSEESAVFLSKVMGVRLDQQDIDALTQRTEGWIAGLQLAALSLRSLPDAHQFVQSFTGSNRYVLDYLFEEVYRQQPAEVQSFLLKTSVLDRLTAPLCNTLTGDDDGQVQLEKLEKINLFIIPLDSARQWYRYHKLFADLLHHLLRMSAEPPEAALHQCASRWFWENGSPIEAVHHALAAEDWELVAEQVQGAGAAMLNRGEVVLLLSWFARLPSELLRTRSDLSLTYAWALMLAGQFDLAKPILEHTEQSIQGNRALMGDVAAAQAYLAQSLGEGRRMIELSHQALALLPKDQLSTRGLVAMNLGIAYWHIGRLSEAQQALEEAYAATQQSGNTLGELMARLFLGRNLAVRGQLRQAATWFESLAEEVNRVFAFPLVDLDLCTLKLEWNDLESAAVHLTRGLESSQLSGNLEFQIAAYMLQARLKLVQGDPSSVAQALEKASKLEQTSTIPLRTQARVADLQVQLALRIGDLETARHLARQLVPDSDAHPFYRMLGLTPARLRLAEGRRTEAAKQLAVAAQTAQHNGWGYGLIAARVLQALAAESSETAMKYLGEALDLGQPGGFIQTFAEAGERLVPLLQEAARRGLHPEYVGRILAAIQTGRRGVPLFAGLVEPLSERELEVLRLVAAGLSNREIAARLVIGVSTAKSHVHNICGKLGANNRAHAVTRARELNLL